MLNPRKKSFVWSELINFPGKYLYLVFNFIFQKALTGESKIIKGCTNHKMGNNFWEHCVLQSHILTQMGISRYSRPRHLLIYNTYRCVTDFSTEIKGCKYVSAVNIPSQDFFT